MSLDKTAIETLSVNAVKDSVVASEFLSQFIAENDKEPSWDGFIYIYGNKSKKKTELKGRMPVQVKGKECNDHSKDTISFSMETSDLRNYLFDGGCILFVVYIGNEGITKKIYYAELTPIKIRKLLNEAKEQGSKTVQLREFPNDNQQKATIFFNCLQNCQKQASLGEGELLSLEELQKEGVLENIIVPFSGVGVDDPQMALIKNEVYLYAKIKGSSIPQPIDIIPEDVHTKQVIDALITVDDKTFYTEYKVIRNSREATLCLGDSFKMVFCEKNNSCKIKYKNSSKIRVLAKDLDFLIAYLDKGYFKINEIQVPFDYNGVDTDNFDIEKERDHLKYAKRVVDTLDVLGCFDDIDTNDMEDTDWRNLHRLENAFIDKKQVEGLSQGLPPVCCMKVGKLRIVVHLKELGEKGMYEIGDFFNDEFNVAFEDNEGNMLPISPFCILHKDDFLTINNMKFEKLLPSYQKPEHHYETFNRANWFLLELLSAYDKADVTRRDKLIKTCDEFSKWIMEASDTELDYSVKILNRLQVVKRQREFSDDEISSLYEIVESGEVNESCVVGAYLLLGQQQAAKIHFKKLSAKEQEDFKEYPIYKYWKAEEK